ncbi:tol-pal system protein YbgF [Aliikangiella coralliicola]|uniref:Cell division coordinator CpoB n=1 Tax=Aliikangiella coralliicola TaxID=2592383 RepID=A0A545UBS1_9GAMM|nr:tol-pal system protein YbgF [Aliikangiella coralliicola]TQV86915.1 tol-pal system protein YbgF [Aliikangiella coralliicola]
MTDKSLLLVATFVATVSSSVSAASQSTLEQRIEQLEQQNQTRSQLQSEMSTQVIELQKEVRELRGIIEEHEFKLQQIQERQRDLYRDIETRLSAIPRNNSSSNQAQTSTSSSTAVKTPVVSPNTASQVRQAVGSGDERKEFEAAFKLVRNKEYTKAVQGFEAFLQQYPSGSYSDNARFWIGQVYFAQSKLVEAEQQFVQLRKDFPDSSKMSAAILKIAEIKVKQEKWQEAKALYNEVVSKYSGAPQQLARKGLQDIKQAGH